MKTLKVFLGIFTIMMLCLSSDAALVMRLNFDGTPANRVENYVIAVPDTDCTPTIHVTQSPAGSARDYGLMPPDPGTQTGHYPSIVTPPSAGFQGGNAFFTCLGDASDSQQHIGYYINKETGFTMSGDFTAEVIFMLAKIGTPTDPVVDCEYSLQDIFGTAMIDNGGANWEIRVFGNGIIGGTGQIQLCNNGNSGLSETTVTGPNLVINQWYHAAVVYTASSNTTEFFVDGVSRGTANPNWAGSSVMNDWWIGAWPSNGANRGMAGWIDAVAVSNVALTPSTFNLPRSGYSHIEVWNLY